MAFKSLKHKRCLISLLKEIDSSENSNDRVIDSHKVNVVRKLTILLKNTYFEISATKQFRNSISLPRLLLNDTDGNLIITDSFPLLNRRFKIMEIIGMGTFSQILKATDTLSTTKVTSVAIKVMKSEYNILGRREYTIIQYLAARCLRGTNNCNLYIFITIYLYCGNNPSR